MRVDVVYALPEGAKVVTVRLAPGATVADAVAAAGLQGDAFGVFGKRVSPDHPVSEGDRVEIYRPLRMDPKEARRLRVKNVAKTSSPRRRG